MNIVLDNIFFYPVNYCINSVLGSYLKFYGIDMYEDLLGQIWDFYVSLSSCNEYLSLRKICIRPMKYKVIDVLSSGFGVEVQKLYITNMSEIIKTCKLFLQQGKPIIAGADPFFFEHYENYKKYHGLKWHHYILIYGIDLDQEQILYIDNTRGFVKGYKHSLSFSDLTKAMVPEHNIFELAPEMYILKMENFHSSLDKKYMRRFHQSDSNAKECLVADKADGIKLLRKIVKEISYIKNNELQECITADCLNQIALVAQHRKANSNYLSKIGELSTAEKVGYIAKQWEKIKYSLSPLRNKGYQEKYQNFNNYLDEIYKLEKEVYDARIFV